jgi:hypothetical protein
MPDRPIERLKQLLVPPMSAKAKRVAEETLRSPMADTLWQISGGGKPFTMSSPVAMIRERASGAIASYRPLLDIVGLDPSALDGNENNMRSDATRSVSHEAGHRADSRLSNAPGRNAPFRLPSVDLPPALPRSSNTGALVQVSPKEWKVLEQESNDPFKRQRELANKARGKVDQYYQTSPEEGYAQAFANAMTVLRSAPRMLQEGATPQEYAEELGKIEAETPGTGGIVESLLKEKPFQQHPLQRIYKRKVAGR